MSNIDAVASDLFATISSYIDKRITAAIEKMTADMQIKIDAVANDDAARHNAALEENSMTDAIVSDLLKTVAELKAMPPAKDGERGADGVNGTNGKDAEPIDFDAVVKMVVAAIPVPANGKDGADGQDGKDGEDAEPVDVPALVKTIEAAIAVPKDGVNGKDGEDGRDGRDAIQCDVLDVIDPERRYQRGTFATHNGGLIRAFRATDPMADGTLEKAGWAVVVEGIAAIQITQDEDLRTFAIGAELTSGKAFGEAFKLPVIIDRGKFAVGEKYSKGDALTWDGSLWIAQGNIEKAGDKPLPPDWRLSVKRGQDGKDLRPEEAPRVREPLRLR